MVPFTELNYQGSDTAPNQILNMEIPDSVIQNFCFMISMYALNILL